MFWEKPQKPIPIGNFELQVGVYVWIDRSWKEHPFATNRFLIKTEDDLNLIKTIGTDNLYWIPEKSKLKPLAPTEKLVKVENVVAIKEATTKQIEATISKKNEKAALQRRLLAKADREWEKSAALVKDAMISIRDNPKHNGTKLKLLSETIAQEVSKNDTLIMLLNERNSENVYHHSLNCMSLSVLLAKFLKLPEKVISEIALGALAHDVGKTMIPRHILVSTSRNKVEQGIYKDHCRLGLEIVKLTDVFSPLAKSIIADHHEHFDGSGYPLGKKGSEISIPAKIVGIVNRYENLCGVKNKDGMELRPDSVLRFMWHTEKSFYDPAFLAAFIKMLGVYPPGTIVSLSDGSIGLVISSGENSLYPKVIIYDENLIKDEAEIIDLNPDSGISIESSIHPNNLSSDVLAWMKAGEKFTFYFASMSKP
jgi:putative nucleotidyltransferase with HDIG domain